ncbi:family 20 glycosylhydrolase [Paraferrimonas sedimenticola]|uniref:beta-N-acetylhexosaminidase n=1 Tax=Paraferrimonas sedimenticola TaxID=375674 RepID=A0AA37RXL6_9GAMM|nr:family 20 glycosylhydrolase [Paraferrimonas sedimenticola]GLP97279.1 beta-N-acetylhexosaminidase [Paraferrimonas sedimenticola]
MKPLHYSPFPLLSCAALCLTAMPSIAETAVDWPSFAQQLQFKQGVVSNVRESGKHTGVIQLTNTGSQTLPAGQSDWSLYIHNIRFIDKVFNDSVVIKHIQGDLFQLTPTASFAGLAPGEQLTVEYQGGNWVASESDFMPRAFLVGPNGSAITIANSDSENYNDFVIPFTTQAQLKRYPEDKFTQADLEWRYQRNQGAYAQTNTASPRLIPSPKSVSINPGETQLNADWHLEYDAKLTDSADLLLSELAQHQIQLSNASTAANRPLKLSIDSNLAESESYRLTITQDAIQIRGADNAGVYYGVQSLLRLIPLDAKHSATLPNLVIEDAPLYSWRGMHYDIGRNFHGKHAIAQLIEQMGRYKLNRLHLHLSDDEGWRLAIPGLPELTEVGGKRCFDLSEQACLLPQLGNGPHANAAGNGYLSKADFIELLTLAKRHHIQVIPELDTPGHARAAIKAMEARYQRLKAQNQLQAAQEFLLSESGDTSEYLSVQNYTDNAINVCLESSYRFMDKIITEVQKMYQQADAPLDWFHFGGDETPKGAWEGSPSCQALIQDKSNSVNQVADLKAYFSARVSQIAKAKGLNLAGWEDGLMYDQTQPFAREQFATDKVLAHAWDNIWEWGVADRAYRLANADYQVVLSSVTHLYLDHPYEVSPQERGYYWGARFIDTQKTFGFNPLDLYANADYTRAGDAITDLVKLVGRELPGLQKPQNLLGIQGQLWSETVRTREQMQAMVFPRLAAIAERAWHQADWQGKNLVQQQHADWASFAQRMGHYELPRLIQAGIHPRLPLPGAKVVDKQLLLNSPFPGLTLEYSVDGEHWQNYSASSRLSADGDYWLRTRVADKVSRAARYQSQ